MDEQLAFYSIVLNWSFSDHPDDNQHKEGELKSNHNNYNNENTNHGNNSMLTDDISQPPFKKRKIDNRNNNNNNNNNNNTSSNFKLEPLTVPPPLEPTDSNSTPPPKSKSPLSPLLMKIPKKSNEQTNNNHTETLAKPIQKLTEQSSSKKSKRFKRPVAKTNKQSNNQATIDDFNTLYPVEKFIRRTKFHSNNKRAEQLLSICTFPNVDSYIEHFWALLFDDLRARLDSQIRDEIKYNYNKICDMLPAELINDIGHTEYICCSFQILSSSNNNNWMYKVNNMMLVLIIYGNNINQKNNNKNKNNKLPWTHILGIIDEQPSVSHIKVQIHLRSDDTRYSSFISCFDSEKIKRPSMKILFLDNIQNRQREFRAICNAKKLRLRDIIIDPKCSLLQNKYFSQRENKNNNISTWKYVPDAYRKRLGRYLNSSQCKAIEVACQSFGITLLQGPPGTGKTRTVLHLMNAYHIAKTQIMFESWLKTMYNKFHNNRNNNSHSAQTITQVNKPRILVLAPSNAAVDEIIIRLMDQQFVDGNDFKYRPPITRIGNMEKCRMEVGKQVSLQSKVEAFLKHKYNQNYEQKININKLNDRIRFFKQKKIENELKLNEFIKSRLILFQQMDFESFQCNESSKIIQFLQEIHNNTKELQRCIWVKTLSKKAAKDKLIISILLESEIIFSTLNSSGGRDLRLLYDEYKEQQRLLFDTSSNYNNKLFDHCIIDEAGQCTEPDILIPLQFDIDSVVLVGDPQQLPATVFACGPSAWLYERSLFERLMNCGYPVHLLNIQYRMHPEIAFFPNIHFYSDKLKNGNNVLGPKYVFNFHKHVSQLYKPFLFFNIQCSNEKRSKFGQSLYNKYEVEFIIQHLKSFYTLYDNHLDINIINNLSIGIITPYKQQQIKIFDKIKLCKYLNKKNIEVATVDFYQGREKDIVLFSCVRAGGKNGIGFLSDIRRMNVAITRAKYSLWIIGNINSLSRNPDWESLIKYAKNKKCMKFIKYNQKSKQYTLISNNSNTNNQKQIINNNNNNKIQSMPMIIDYGDINQHQQHHHTPSPRIIHHQPPPLPRPHIIHHTPPHPQFPLPQGLSPQTHHHTQIVQIRHHSHPPPIPHRPPIHHLNHRQLMHNQHIINNQHNNLNHNNIHNNNNPNLLIDYTKTHTNSSAFDD